MRRWIVLLRCRQEQPRPSRFPISNRCGHSMRSGPASSSHLWWIWLPAVLTRQFSSSSLRDLRFAILLGLLFGYFCGYPAIQFNTRHILHLSLIPIAAVAFVLQTMIGRQWGAEWRNALHRGSDRDCVVVVPLLLLRTDAGPDRSQIVNPRLPGRAGGGRRHSSTRALAKRPRRARLQSSPSGRGAVNSPAASLPTISLRNFDASACNLYRR